MDGIAAILFDLDDTLLDRRRTIERYLAGHAHRAGLSPELADAFRTRFHALDGNGHTSRDVVFSGLSAAFPSIGTADGFGNDFREHAFATCEYVGGARDVLAWCRGASLRLGVVTNGSSEMQRAKLRALGLADLVDVILVSGEEGVAKPDAEIFHRAADRLRVRPEQCVFVGDNPHADVDGARRAGMLGVWFERAFPWPAELDPPSHSISRLAVLRELLGRRAPRAPGLR